MNAQQTQLSTLLGANSNAPGAHSQSAAPTFMGGRHMSSTDFNSTMSHNAAGPMSNSSEVAAPPGSRKRCNNFSTPSVKLFRKQIATGAQNTSTDQKKIVELEEAMDEKDGKIMELERAIWEHRTVTAHENSKIQEEIRKMAREKNLETRGLEGRNKELELRVEHLERAEKADQLKFRRMEKKAFKAFREKLDEAKAEVERLNTEKKAMETEIGNLKVLLEQKETELKTYKASQESEKDNLLKKVAALEEENERFRETNATLLQPFFSSLHNSNGQCGIVKRQKNGGDEDVFEMTVLDKKKEEKTMEKKELEAQNKEVEKKMKTMEKENDKLKEGIDARSNEIARIQKENSSK